MKEIINEHTASSRDKSMLPIFVAVSVSFLLAIIVSIYSLTKLARENTKEIDTMLTYRIYDSISSSLNEPITVAKTMTCDDFLADFLEKEGKLEEDEAVDIMQRYLNSLKTSLGYDSAFLVSEKSRRYYTYEGLNKIVDPEHDKHDIWYSLFLEKDKPYDLDVDSDEVNQGQWTVFVNARIEDKAGKLLGVCGVGVQMTNLQELFRTSEQEYGVKINLVDGNGLVQVDTDDINIENAWLDEDVLSQKETEEYHYQTTGNNEFVVTKYVEYLGWYLVVRSAPTSINRDFINIIILNVVLFLLVMAILIFTVAFILRRSKKERDDRERLLIVSERAVAANEAKSSFLSSMSHEIRTPINAVLGMNEMILREADDERILEYSSNIQNAGRTLLSLINSILDFSKIEEGKMEIVPVEYNTASLINNLVASVADRARDKGLDFIVEVDEKLPAGMVGDDVRLSQVILNLLTNAVKYTDKGSVRFTIREDRREGHDAYLFVAVEDTGIGIRQEDMPRLFASFERLDEVKNHSIEGTGLGMSIVTSLLKLMDSEICLESEYGKGSTFYFVVRQKISDERQIGDYSRRFVASRRHSSTESLRAPAARILVVDDNEMNLKVAGSLLGLFGIKAQYAGSGYEAIERLKTEHFHIILLDHMMPKMDGIETLNIMRSEKLLPDDTVVIALTANAVNGARERYLSAGFDDYLSKPMEVSQLEDLLSRCLPKEIMEWDGKEPEKESKGELETIQEDRRRDIREAGQKDIRKHIQKDAKETGQKDVRKNEQTNTRKHGQKDIIKNRQRDIEEDKQNKIRKSGQKDNSNNEMEKERGKRTMADWVIVVDDDETNLKMAGRILSRAHMRVTAMKSGRALLNYIREKEVPDLILLDIKMPDMDGFETLSALRATDKGKDVPVIFLTADEKESTEVKGLSLGAMDFIKKPFVPEILTLRVRHMIDLDHLQRNLASEVEKKTREIEGLFLHVVSSLASAIDAKDTYTNGHSDRVAEYSREIASRAGYQGKDLEDIYMMGLLHDVGKIGIPDAVINKPARLTDEEYDIIKNHPVMGARILGNIKEMPKLVNGARWHHERIDGKGYPDGLSGENIPEEARIIAVADAYDAMTSHRSYREPLPQDVVRKELEAGKGSQFDPRFADIMLGMMEEDVGYQMRELK